MPRSINHSHARWGDPPIHLNQWLIVISAASLGRRGFDELLERIQKLCLVQAMGIASGRAYGPRSWRDPLQHPSIDDNFESIRHLDDV
jgi:hypothetical protein